METSGVPSQLQATAHGPTTVIDEPRHSLAGTGRRPNLRRRGSSRGPRWPREEEVLSMSTVQPRTWYNDLSTIPKNFMRQILGLNPFKTSYFGLYRPLKDWRSRTVLAAGFILAAAAGIPLPIIGVLFGKIINEFPPPEDVLRIRIGQLLGTASAYFVVTWGWALCWGYTGERLTRRLREAVLEQALGMEMAYHDVEAPEISNMLTEKTQTIHLGTAEKVGLFIQSISYFLAAFTVGFILNAKLTGILFGSIIPAMVIIVCTGTTLVSKLSKKASELSEQAAAVAEGAISAVGVVQAFGAQDVLCADHQRLLRLSVSYGIRKSIAGALMLGSVYFVAYAANALAFWQGSRIFASENGGGNAGTVYAVVFLILDASFVVGQFGPFIQTFALAAAAGEKIFTLLNHADSHINVYAAAGVKPSTSTFAEDVRLKDVTFVYPARPTVRVLDRANLIFEAGRMTAIVGPSGSGKSTIASLLLRLYDPSSGRIMLGDRDIRDFHIPSFRSRIALVSQQPVLFSGTILDNIAHGLGVDSNINDQERLRRCLNAAHEANADFIHELPDGIHTVVGVASGTELSGGQRQRICLARALVGNPSLLILDEPTSALDATSETLVIEALRRAASVSGRTTIMIAHRLSTIRDADKIVVMAHGAVVEEGTHESLMKRSGAYSELVKAQQIDQTPSAPSTPESKPSSSPALDGDIMEKDPLSAPVAVREESEDEKPKRLGGFAIVGRSFDMSRPEALYVAIGLGASILSGAIITGEAVIFGHLVQILNEYPSIQVLKDRADFYCLMFFILALVALLAYSLSGSTFGVVSEHLMLRIQDVSLRTILRQDMAWFSEADHSSQALMGRLNSDSGHISGLSGVIIGTFFSVFISVTGGIVLALIVAWKIAVVLLAAVPVMLVAGFLRLRILSKSEERQKTAYTDAVALASEAVGAVRTVAALGREKDVLRLYRNAVDAPYKESLKFNAIGNLLLALSLAITYFVYALAYWWGAKQVRNGSYSQLQFFIVLPALLFSAQAAGQMFSLAPEITRAKTAAKSIFELHDQKASIITAPTTTGKSIINKPPFPGSEPSSDSETEKCKGVVEFRNVHLTYPSRPNQPALRDVTLSVAAGSFVAFVGPSGAGKSTLISLLERFYDPVSGAVLLDGQDIRNIPVEEHRAKLGYVAQEPDLFPGSVAFNVGLGATPGHTATQDEIVSVCQRCGIHDFIMSLPEAYNTECGSNGSRLSGGQKQRIAVARALIRNPEILLLDEATSALDSHSEREVQNAIAAASSGRTTIMIAHRLASVQKADRIFVLDKGSVVEQGRHEDLVALGGIYASMVMAQELS